MYPMYDGVPASLLRDLGGPAMTWSSLILSGGDLDSLQLPSFIQSP